MDIIAKKFRLGVAVLALLAGSVASANARLWSFSYDFGLPNLGADVTASGVLTTSDSLNPDGSYTITGITGTRTYNGEIEIITALIAPGGYAGNDNELFPFPHLPFSNDLTDHGFSYSFSGPLNGDDGGTQVNVFFLSHDFLQMENLYVENSPDVGQSSSFTVSPIVAVPEPTTWAMLVVGFAGLGLAGLRRKHMPKTSGA
jgi:hypothetical protein